MHISIEKKRLCLDKKLQNAFDSMKDSFMVSDIELKKLARQFEKEMEKGLEQPFDSIPMIPTWVTEHPTGNEHGEYLALDLGGTNLRVVSVSLKGNCDFEFEHTKYPLPASLRHCSCSELWAHIVGCIEDYLLQKYSPLPKEPLPMGFTFSFPASQDRIDQGVLQRWTKGFNIPDVEGKDVVFLLQEEIDKRKLPVKVTALINDTTGTLIASEYSDPETKMGLIFGTGVNAAYFDRIDQIGKMRETVSENLIKTQTPIAINTEYGAFDNEHRYLKRTKYDIYIDENSTRPNQQSYEKMVSGYYLGEILRLVLLDFAIGGMIFKGQDIHKLKIPFIMDASYPARAEEDDYKQLPLIDKIMKTSLGIQTTPCERQLIQEISILIGTRAARLSACAIAAICRKMNIQSGHCACDGSVFKKYPFFTMRVENALRGIFDWKQGKEIPLKLVAAEDGSGVGAAIVACLAKKAANKKTS